MMRFTQLTRLFWMLLVLTPSISVAETEIVGMGSQQLAREHGLEFATGKQTRGLNRNADAAPATQDSTDDEPEDC